MTKRRKRGVKVEIFGNMTLRRGERRNPAKEIAVSRGFSVASIIKFLQNPHRVKQTKRDTKNRNEIVIKRKSSSLCAPFPRLPRVSLSIFDFLRYHENLRAIFHHRFPRFVVFFSATIRDRSRYVQCTPRLRYDDCLSLAARRSLVRFN